MVNEEPYQGLKCIRTSMETSGVRKDVCTGAAWLSSARDLNCSLKWGNERNPYLVLYVSRETAPPFWQYRILVPKGRGGR